VTPKAKVFHKSRSFHYRHDIVIVAHNWSNHNFLSNVISQLGILPPKIFLSYLDKVGRRKTILKGYHLNVATNGRRAHKQDECEKKLLY